MMNLKVLRLFAVVFLVSVPLLGCQVTVEGGTPSVVPDTERIIGRWFMVESRPSPQEVVYAALTNFIPPGSISNFSLNVTNIIVFDRTTMSNYSWTHLYFYLLSNGIVVDTNSTISTNASVMYYRMNTNDKTVMASTNSNFSVTNSTVSYNFISDTRVSFTYTNSIPITMTFQKQ